MSQPHECDRLHVNIAHLGNFTAIFTLKRLCQAKKEQIVLMVWLLCQFDSQFRDHLTEFEESLYVFVFYYVRSDVRQAPYIGKHHREMSLCLGHFEVSIQEVLIKEPILAEGVNFDGLLAEEDEVLAPLYGGVLLDTEFEPLYDCVPQICLVLVCDQVGYESETSPFDGITRECDQSV